MRLHNLIPLAFLQLRRSDGRSALLEAIMSNPTTEGMVKQHSAVHWSKTVRFLTAATSMPRMSMLVSLMQPALDVMSTLFEMSSGDHSLSLVSALDFAHVKTSPPMAAIRLYASYMADMGNDFWKPFCPGDWSPGLMQLAFRTTLELMGNIWFRGVVPFQCWPWPLALLAHPSAEEAEKAHVAERFFAARGCCLDVGMSQPFKASLRNVAELRSEDTTMLLADVFARVPLNNIAIENRFGRQRKQAGRTGGRPMSHTSLAHKHVLSEFKLMHATAVRRLACRSGPKLCRCFFR